MAWCVRCKKEVEAIGPRNNQCPVCNTIVRVNAPEKKSSEEFSTGFSGTLQPEEVMQLKRLKQAGYIDKPTDVMKYGLQSMISKFSLDGNSQGKPSVAEDPMDKAVETMREIAMQKTKASALTELQKMAYGQGDGVKDTLSFKDLKEMFMLSILSDAFTKKTGGGGGESEALKMQIQNMQHQMDTQQQQNQWQQQMAIFGQKNNTDNDLFTKMMQFNQMKSQEQSQTQAQIDALRTEGFNTQVNMLREKLDSMSNTNKWDSQLHEQINDVVGKKFLDDWKKGLSTAQPEKSTMDSIGEFMQTVAPTIQQLVGAYAASKQQPQQPQYAPYPPMQQRPMQQAPYPVPPGETDINSKNQAIPEPKGVKGSILGELDEQFSKDSFSA